MTSPETFYQKYGKGIFDLTLSSIGLSLLWPLFVLIAFFIKLDSQGNVIFRQKRVGRNGKIFTLYKFRTMVANAEELKAKYARLNEADGPVFKIRDDPRYTKIGKILSHTGLDELPQLVNILKGQMSLVGPRPLPIDEEAKILSKVQKLRRQVRPGITSSWLIKGGHNLTFVQWMKHDLKDIDKSSLVHDLDSLLKTLLLVARLIKDT